MAEVRVEHVWKFYREELGESGRVLAVEDVSFVCEDKSFLCLLGPSGCGKTTTLRMIAGLEKISKGDIYIGQRKVNNLHPRDRQIAMAFESYALYPPLTVFDNIAFPLRARKYPEKKIRDKINTVAELLEIQDILNHRPARLSGGEQQRVSLARALVREDALVTLMDEPISHLDSQLKAKLRIELKRVQEEWGLTVIYVTHDQLEALSMADRVVVMNLGRIQQIGSPIELYEKPSNLFVAGFIGEPPMNFIECALAKEGDKFFLRSTFFNFELDRGLGSEIAKESKAPQKLIMGVRPGDMTLGKSEDAESYSLQGQIFSIEPHGESSVVILNLEKDVQIYVEVPGLPEAAEGEVAWVSFPKQKMHVFDGETGEVIRIS